MFCIWRGCSEPDLPKHPAGDLVNECQGNKLQNTVFLRLKDGQNKSKTIWIFYPSRYDVIL